MNKVKLKRFNKCVKYRDSGSRDNETSNISAIYLMGRCFFMRQISIYKNEEEKKLSTGGGIFPPGM